MAYTKIKNIKYTVNKAIEYITNFNKTNNGTLVYGYNVTPKTASIEFSFTEKMAKNVVGDYKKENGNLAYHLIQSFDYKDILTPQEALEIGRKTVEQLTGGKFEYVIATHVDKTCIHNHIIFNSVSFVDFKRFNSEPYKTVEKLRNISDKICLDSGLNIIEKKLNQGKSYYEWSMAKEGLSWKQNLKNVIDKNVLIANSFAEFINLMKKDNYEVKTGKYLAFKNIGQERYIRIHKLGEKYSEEIIKQRIDSKIKYRMIKNKNTSKKDLPLNVLFAIKSRKKALNNIQEISKLINELKQVEQYIKNKQEEQRQILIYDKYKELNLKYKKAFNKNQFRNKYEAELTLFTSAEKYIATNNIQNIDVIKVQNEKLLQQLQNKYVDLKKQLKLQKSNIEIIEKLEGRLKECLNKSHEKKQYKHRKIDISL